MILMIMNKSTFYAITKDIIQNLALTSIYHI
jgi:hypothetical protein